MNPNTDFETVTARGDHGGITFRKSDGVVVSRDFYSVSDSPELHGYPFILRANPDTFLYPDMDILHVGYWYQDSRGQLAYEPAIDMDEDLAPSFDNKEPVTMKPFDLAKAKAGAPVITRDGRKARILSFDLCNRYYPVAAAFSDSGGVEGVVSLTNEGKCFADKDSANDLFMAPVKREGWVNLYRPAPGGAQDCYPQPLIFNTREEAIAAAYPSSLRATTRIEWED